MELRPLVLRLATWSARPQDPPGVLLEKGLLVLAGLTATVVELGFLVLYAWLGLHFVPLIVASAALLFALNTAMFRVHGGSAIYLRILLGGVLASVGGGMVVMGGWPPVITLSVWALLVPFAAAAFFSRRESWGWFAAYLLAILPPIFFHLPLHPAFANAPEWVTPGFYALNLSSLAFVGFVLFQRVTEDRQEALGSARDAHARSESLLLNILPPAIAERLKAQPGTIADHFQAVTILFADIVGFTTLSARIPPEKLVNMLNGIFSDFDDLADKHGLEKIKTIGDAYMVVGGLPVPREDHARAVCAMALDMLEAVHRHSGVLGEPLDVRVGIHSGPAVAGVIGRRKFIYDLWGDAVNTASRMESHGQPGQVQVSEATHALVVDAFELQPRGDVEIKGKGAMRTWFLKGRKTS